MRRGMPNLSGAQRLPPVGFAVCGRFRIFVRPDRDTTSNRMHTDMEHFDFDEIVPRRGTCSVKWDDGVPDGVLPMWVADMDFRTAPAVVEALRRRVEHGIYGYATVPESYYGAVTSWFSRRHGWAPGSGSPR